MANDVRRLTKLAKAQGWRVEHGTRHLKWYNPRGVCVATSPAKIPEANFRLIRNFEADLRRAGFLFTIPPRLKEKPVTSVSDLIKANGMAESPPPTKPEAPAKRQSRKGLDDEILVVLKAHYPHDVDTTTLKMKVSLNYPGVNSSSIFLALSKLKAAGKVLSAQKGLYRAVSPEPEVKTPAPPVVPALPTDAQLAIDNLLSAVAEVERVIKTLQGQLAALDAVKKLLVG